nr:hypothetical protein Itr_chr06CG00060 [Ipomoea trifida]GMD10986.1 hypothetical protein Iba_chr06fCG0040 [Ipomoea batatas]
MAMDMNMIELLEEGIKAMEKASRHVCALVFYKEKRAEVVVTPLVGLAASGLPLFSLPGRPCIFSILFSYLIVPYLLTSGPEGQRKNTATARRTNCIEEEGDWPSYFLEEVIFARRILNETGDNGRYHISLE